MHQRTKHRLIKGWLAACIALLSSTLVSLPVLAAGSAPASVTRIGGADQYATAALMAEKGWPGTSDNVVLSAGMNYSLVDALAAGPLARALKAPILLTDDGQTLNTAARTELIRLKPQKVYITSGSAVIKPAVLEELKELGITPVPLGGYDQYETSVNIAKEMAQQGVKSSQIVLAAGWVSPADALSIAPIAAAQGIPILTTARDQLPASVQNYLDSIKGNIANSYVVGGTAVIADVVKGQLPGSVSRYAGQTKYDTNVQILSDFAQDYSNSKVYVANGETLVDALAGVSLAASDQAPLVLVGQQLPQATENFVRLNMSTADLVAIGGEAVVPTAEIKVLTSAVAYTTDGEVLGSADSAKPLEMSDNVQIAGDNVTLAHAKADYSVYLQGSNITLSDVAVQGSVFVDPGSSGTVILDGVSAAKIVILSGGSVQLKDSKVNSLIVDSTGPESSIMSTSAADGTAAGTVNVAIAGTGSIGNIILRSSAILDAQGGLLGEVFLNPSPGETPVVELRGTFTQPVIVQGQANLKADAEAVISSVLIKASNLDQTVTLAGNFQAVEVQAQGKLTLAPDSSVETMKVSAKTSIMIPASSEIDSLDIGSTGSEVWGGGKVNGKITETDQPASSVPTTSGSTTSGGGGGSSSQDPTTPAATQLTVSSIKVLASDDVTRQVANGDTVDFTGVSDYVSFTGLKLTTNQPRPTIVITSIRANGLELVGSGQSYSSTLDSNGVVSTSDLLSGLDGGGNGIALRSLRNLADSGNLVFRGKITKSGYTDSDEITVTIHLGAYVEE